jgi:hypothetical protein
MIRKHLRSLVILGLIAGGPALPVQEGRAQDAPATEEAQKTPEQVPDAPPDIVKTFKAAELKSHLNFLASKKCAGRASGTEGCDIAGAYIEEKIIGFGLEPAGDDGGYRQEMTIRLTQFPGQEQLENLGEKATTFNLIGIVRGSDEALKDEYIVMSAHYDHVGRKSAKKIFLGADDNASGSSALLQVARAFAEPDAPRPRRSILFLWCTAEERGLLGSKHYVDNATVPVAQMVANLNIDMVGRNESKEMHVYGNASSPDLDSAHQKAAALGKFRFLAKTGSIFLRSDQVNFYKRDIPCLFFTSGLHSDYHATSDAPKRIDTGKASRAALHAYRTAWELANRTARPRFTKMDESASSGPLGAVLDMLPAEGLPKRVKVKKGYGAALVRTVMDGSRAAKAGLKQGDFILQVGGKDLPENDPVGAVEEAVGRAKKKITLRVARGRKTLRVTVKL